MIFYDKDGIVIRLVEEKDINNIIDLFSKNNFNCDFESGSLKPSNNQLESIIRDSVNNENRTEGFLVLEKDNNFIGYLAMHIDYDRLVLGHIAVKKNERHKNYGRMLTFVALNIASNEDREVICQCFNPKNYLVKIGFRHLGGGTYYKKTKHVDKKIPKVFMSIEDYKALQDKKMKQEVDDFKNFLNSDVARLLMKM